MASRAVQRRLLRRARILVAAGATRLTAFNAGQERNTAPQITEQVEAWLHCRYASDEYVASFVTLLRMGILFVALPNGPAIGIP